uniref:Uncharacterized protein n=1 Tax=Triticum urartu TaxID=4572 RepID=A0A8R7PPE5_TRIUA
MQSPKILNSKLSTKRGHQPICSSSRRTNKDDVINIDQNVHSHLRSLKDKQIRVRCRRHKPMSTKSSAKTCMPHTRGLLQTIKSFDKTTQMMWLSRINKTGRLTHRNLFFQNSMEKSILNVKLLKRPSSSNSQGEKNTNSGWFNNRTECVCIINTIPLFE